VAALALGQIFVGKADGAIAEALVTALLLREKLRSGHFARQLILAIGLLFLGRQGEAEVSLRVGMEACGLFPPTSCPLFFL
jgi:hypothetical protein